MSWVGAVMLASAVLGANINCKSPGGWRMPLVGGPAMRVYVDPDARFHLELPRDWSVVPQGPGAVVDFLARSRREYRGDFRENVNLLRLSFPARFSAEEVREAHLNEIRGRYRRLRLVESGGLERRGAEPVPYAIIELPVAGVPLKDKIYYFMEGRQGSVLTCSARRGTFTRFEKIFDRIAISFRSGRPN